MQDQSLTLQISAFALIGALLATLTFTSLRETKLSPDVPTASQSSAAAASRETPQDPSTEMSQGDAGDESASPIAEIPSIQATDSTPSAEAPREIERIANPYSTPPLPFSDINLAARAALVNIFCNPVGGSLRPISGSGVIIDPRGIVITNAHVAQYVLLAESMRVDLDCSIRTGSPAVARWTPHVLYMPATWVEEHAADITAAKPLGTGEHDYALLYIGTSIDARPRPSSFPYLVSDTREAIAFTGDNMLAAAYPAEFFGGTATHFNLYPVTSITAVGQMYTFKDGSVDAFSLGGIIGAQSGSSGGAAVNAWGRLVGILTTTSDGATTAERDLRAISLASIDRDILKESGKTLSQHLGGDPATAALDFASREAPALVTLIIEQIRR